MAQQGFFPSLINTDNQSVNFGLTNQVSPETALEEQALNRRQQIAQLLLQQGLHGPPQGQMVGRFYVPASPVQGLASLAQAAAGIYGTYKNDEARKALADTERKGMQAELAGAFAPEITEGPRPTAQMAPQAQPNYGLAPRPAQAQPVTTELPGPGAPVETPASSIVMKRRMAELLASRFPQVRAMAGIMAQQQAQQQEREAQRDFLKGEGELNRQNRIDTMQAGFGKDIMLATMLGASKETLENLKSQHAKELERVKVAERSDEGKIPPGYRKTKDGKLEAMEGGPADLKQQGMLNLDTSILQNSVASMDRLAESANQILNHPGLAGITGVRGAVPDIPGTQAADARALLNKLKSQVGFSVLQEMRNNSKTGSALGSVSDAEGKRLENNLASVESAQSIDQMRRELQGILDYTTGAKDRFRDAYNMKHKGGAPVPMTPSTGKGPAVGTIDGGYRFKGGDPGKSDSWEKVQ